MAIFGNIPCRLIKWNAKKTHVVLTCVYEDELEVPHFINVYIKPERAAKLAEKLSDMASNYLRGKESLSK